MHTSFLFASTLCAAGLANAAYTVKDSFNSSNFFEGFTFFSGTDPTNGFVAYQTALSSNNSGLAGYSDGAAYLGVDSTTVNPTGGRQSVRLESKARWTKGLFIADIKHMPGNACGVWPAFWTFGEPWPTKGEIDILEGVNLQSNNSVTLHTSPGCTMSPTGSDPLSVLQSGDCTGEGNAGCSSHSNKPGTYGDDFNAQGGGVYAMEWTSDAISVFFFPRASIPADVLGENPDPKTWGAPMAKFSGGGCPIDKYFSEHKMIFNTAFCGDWAGKSWDAEPKCKALAASCNAYVGQTPQAFTESYWLINSVKVFQDGGAKRRGVSFES